jgi:hypothetical protein
VGTGELTPRVFLRRLEREGDTLAVQVDIENLDVTSVPTSTTSDG